MYINPITSQAIGQNIWKLSRDLHRFKKYKLTYRYGGMGELIYVMNLFTRCLEEKNIKVTKKKNQTIF